MDILPKIPGVLYKFFGKMERNFTVVTSEHPGLHKSKKNCQLNLLTNNQHDKQFSVPKTSCSL